MSTLSPKDRVSLCMFSFADGRRCRTPRTRNHPHFCFDHAQKEARARTAEELGNDLAYFFSGGYVSACDLSIALARILPAVVRGDLKPRTGHTVAYLAQTLMQAIHLSKHEYINAFGTDAWRNSVRNSVDGNYDYRFPPAPKPEPSASPQPASASEQPDSPQPQPQPAARPAQTQPAQPPANCHSVCPDLVGERSEESASPSNSSLATRNSSLPQPRHSSLPQPPATSPRTPLPATSTEFVQQAMAGQNSPATSPIQSSPAGPQSGQQEPEPLRPVDAAVSASRQELRPAAGPQTGPSGLPILAPLPPQRPGAPPSSRSH
jgi:hypothetical protein